MSAYEFKQVTALEAQTLAATTNGAVVDTQGAEEIAFLIAVGDFVTFDGTNNLTWKVQEGDQSDGSDMADIAAGDYILSQYESGSAWADRKMDAAADDQECFKIQVKKSAKRYRRLVATEAGIVSVAAAAVAILSALRHQPANATQAP